MLRKLTGRIAIASLVTVLSFASTSGCKKDDEVNATLDQLDTVSKTIVEKVNSADNPKAGVEAAQKYLDENKEKITASMAELGEVRGFQVGDETKNRLTQSVVDNVTMVSKLQIDLMQATMEDAELDKALDKLVDDYTAAIQP